VPMPEERWLVTGALGCIGTWSCRQLVREGHAVGPTLAMAAAVHGERYEIPFGGRAQFQYAPEAAAVFIDAARSPATATAPPCATSAVRRSTSPT
jgi:nucleoside-diphosphate-sugar epimerase